MIRFAAAAILGAYLASCTSPGIDLPDGESAVTQVTGGRSGADRDPEVSADGKTLLYASSSFGGDLDLFVKEIGSNTAVRLTTREGNERFPKFNPTAPRQVAFCADWSGEWQVYVMEDYERSPDRIVQVSDAGSHNIHPSWSPDGRTLVWCSTEDLGSGDWMLAVRELSASRTRVLEGVDGLLPEWSPQGDTIAFQRMRRRDGWFGSIWTLRYEAGQVRDLRAVFSSDDWAAINPSWSPDGRRLVFATVAQSRARAGVLHESDDVWTVGADGSFPARLTTSPASDGMPCWASDGRVYFVSSRGGSERIWSLVPRAPGAP